MLVLYSHDRNYNISHKEGGLFPVHIVLEGIQSNIDAINKILDIDRYLYMYITHGMEKARHQLLVYKATSLLSLLNRPPHTVVVRGPYSADVVQYLCRHRPEEPILHNVHTFEGEGPFVEMARTTTFRGKRTALVFVRCEHLLSTDTLCPLFALRLPLIFVFGPDDKYRPGRQALLARCAVLWCGSETSSYLPRLLQNRDYEALRKQRDCAGIRQLVHEESIIDFDMAERLSDLAMLQYRVDPQLLETLTEDLVQRATCGSSSRKRRREEPGVLLSCVEHALAQTRGTVPEHTATLDYLHYAPNAEIFRLYRDASSQKKLDLMNNRVLGLRNFASFDDARTETTTLPPPP